MSKHDATRAPKSPTKPDGITEDTELGEQQLNEVSGGFLGFMIGHGAETPKPTPPSGGLHVRKAGGDQQEY
jgi:hypothetical protein